MFVPLLMLAAGSVLLWLSHFDRTSPIALALVQLESQFGFAMWPAFLTAGAVLLIVRFWHARPKPAAPTRPLTRDAARTRPPRALDAGLAADEPPAPETGGPTWLATLRAGARAVSDDPMGRVRFDGAVPIMLVLTGVTREQARRRIAAYAAWLATIPVPPTARVRVVSSPDIEAPLHGLFRGELAKHFPADAFHVASNHEGADAMFSWPDPRWGA